MPPLHLCVYLKAKHFGITLSFFEYHQLFHWQIFKRNLLTWGTISKSLKVKIKPTEHRLPVFRPVSMRQVKQLVSDILFRPMHLEDGQAIMIRTNHFIGIKSRIAVLMVVAHLDCPWCDQCKYARGFCKSKTIWKHLAYAIGIHYSRFKGSDADYGHCCFKIGRASCRERVIV